MRVDVLANWSAHDHYNIIIYNGYKRGEEEEGDGGGRGRGEEKRGRDSYSDWVSSMSSKSGALSTFESTSRKTTRAGNSSAGSR